MNYFDGCTTPAEVKARWRELARQHHPDHGGDAATFNEVKTQYDAAMVQAMKPVKCEACNGVGQIIERHGFSQVGMRCQACKGKGQIHR